MIVLAVGNPMLTTMGLAAVATVAPSVLIAPTMIRPGNTNGR